MKKLIPIIIIAAVTNLIVKLIFDYSNNAPTGETPHWDHIMDVIWIIGMLAGITIAIINRKYLFKKATMIIATLAALLFCTPFPFILIVVLTN
ncbi:hypothetical protein HDF18_19975 [Mucilaginibacter sp. X5P1]|uniref:hypothetical protein n=1 Tax=Mucilaginibacter sp. X5P1 TaxID=2723088 RepID=UPI0016161886|nr:hypothetical protein [Mucilaginibacter sp. X5P1]MBB6139935.1 hypothetical protein [Mucilaginibacter sp. X5P1]